MFRYIDTKDSNNKLEISKLIYEANSEFYEIFEKSKDEINSNLCEMISDERTEEFNTKSINIDDEIIGIVSFYNSEEIYYRQIFSLNYLQNNSYIDSNKLSAFSNEVPTIDNKSLYISRLSIDSSFQGKGYAYKILNHIEKEAEKENYEFISLHVNKNNTRAISAYKKSGFKIKNDKKNYLIMLKEI